jgi:RNA polymerase sigma-70 factor (ECF subfamily)
VSSNHGFAELIRRVRQGDAEAAAEVVERYEPEIHRAVRLRLTDPGLRRVLDSMDICQSVFANLFVRAGAGQFDLRQPDQLLRLLVVMARNKLRDQVSFHQAARRDQRRVEADAAAPLAQARSVAPSPSDALSARELLQALRAALTPEERQLAELRALGRDWKSIATQLGERPDTLRKRLSAALNRASRELGLDEVDDVCAFLKGRRMMFSWVRRSVRMAGGSPGPLRQG